MRHATLLFAALAVLVAAECPNGCSGNGDCGINDACTCYVTYDGPDCSQRRCATDLAFVDVPRGDLNHDGTTSVSGAYTTTYSKVQWSNFLQYEYWPSVAGALAYKDSQAAGTINPLATTGGGWAAQPDEAHFYAECSGKGTCDHTTGLCTCFNGYKGGACQRTSCPNDCSGNGLCRTLQDIASGGLNKVFSSSTAGVNYYTGVSNSFSYGLWDKQKNAACVCDPGYTGPDCSMRECPRGNDPLTMTSASCGNSPCSNAVQGFTVTTTNNNNLNYYITFFDFRGTSYTSSDFALLTGGTAASNAANAAVVKNALESLPNNVTGIVSVTSGFDVLSNVRILVTFTTLPGSVPPFVVSRGRSSPGVTPVANPVQTVQTFFVPTAAVASGTSVSLTLFPTSLTGFRISQFTSPATFTLAGSNVAALQAALTAVFNTATNSPTAFQYKYGTTGASATAIATTGGFNILVIFPDPSVGSQPANLVFGSTAYTGTLDSVVGNLALVMCSNRGICDYTSGLCQCFTGYVGDSCTVQNALSM